MAWWGKDQPDFANHKTKQVTWEQVESKEGVGYPDKRHTHTLNRTWKEVRPDLAAAGVPPHKWHLDCKKDYQDFKAEYQEDDELWTFYADYGILAERAGLVIIRNGQYIASLIVWLS